MWQQLNKDIMEGDVKALARCISLIENEAEGYNDFLQNLSSSKVPVIGITGPPGAGKSTLVDALIGEMAADNKKVAVLCIDPSSPFNLGSLLGDRIRMSQWYNNPNVFIRSLATRGALGGLHPKIIEITDVIKMAGFDFIIIETVGVGQSEIEIAGLADTTVVVVVPESGDEVQTMKAGLMEIADIFVVNKSDRPGANTYLKNLRLMLAPSFHNHQNEIPILATVASKNEGIRVLMEKINQNQPLQNAGRKKQLLTEKIYQLIQAKRMKDVDKSILQEQINALPADFNIYKFVDDFK